MCANSGRIPITYLNAQRGITPYRKVSNVKWIFVEIENLHLVHVCVCVIMKKNLSLT